MIPLVVLYSVILPDREKISLVTLSGAGPVQWWKEEVSHYRANHSTFDGEGSVTDFEKKFLQGKKIMLNNTHKNQWGKIFLH